MKFATKWVSVEGRLEIKHVCDRLKIECLESITNPDEESVKAHPHVQYDCGLVDSFRNLPNRFVSLETFKRMLEDTRRLK